MNIRAILLFVFLTSALLPSFSQEISDVYITDERTALYSGVLAAATYDKELMADALMYTLNEELLNNSAQRLKYNVGMNPVALQLSEFLSEQKSGQEIPSKLALATRLENNNFSSAGAFELTAKMPVRLGKDFLSYRKVAQDVVLKWFEYPKTVAILKSGNCVYASIAASIDEDANKVFVSCILHNYKTLNKGAAFIKASGYKISTSAQGLRPYDAKECRAADRYKAIEDIRNGLTVEEDGTIMFNHEDYKSLKKLLNDETDGFVVDLVYNGQFDRCGSDNITDYNLPCRGLLLKKKLQPALLKGNMYEGRDAKFKLKTSLGKVPETDAPYELNLSIIQNGYVCRSLPLSTVERGVFEFSSNVRPMADTLNAFISKEIYKPRPDTFKLSFKIPFELGKAEYKKADLQPLLDSLSRDYLIIRKIKITAFSSVEGADDSNEQLRRQRAQSMKEVFVSQGIHPSKIQTSTKDTWDEFYEDLKKSKYKYLAAMEKDKVKGYIRQKGLEKQLDPLLQPYRYAIIELEVFNDVAGKKEPYFIVQKINRLARERDTVNALKMQKFLMNKILSGKYEPEVAKRMVIPNEPTFAGLLMNKLWLNYRVANKEFDGAFAAEVNKLYALNYRNQYVAFNKAYCNVMFEELLTEKHLQNMQAEIDALYKTQLTRSTIDPLNLQFQLKALGALDTIDVMEPQILQDSIIEQVRRIFNVKQNDWKGAMNVSNLFIREGDYGFAARMMESFLELPSVSDDYIFKYISICSILPDKVNSVSFEKAVALASDRDAGRLCNLFAEKKISYQFLENPQVKNKYCTTCKQ